MLTQKQGGARPRGARCAQGAPPSAPDVCRNPFAAAREASSDASSIGAALQGRTNCERMPCLRPYEGGMRARAVDGRRPSGKCPSKEVRDMQPRALSHNSDDASAPCHGESRDSPDSVRLSTNGKSKAVWTYDNRLTIPASCIRRLRKAALGLELQGVAADAWCPAGPHLG